MSLFKGGMKPRDPLRGSIRGVFPKLSVRIGSISRVSASKLRKVGEYSAGVTKKKTFSAAVNRTYTIYRFLLSRRKVFHRLLSRAATAPSTEIRAVGNLDLMGGSQLSSAPADEIKVDRKVKFSVSARLVAYRRAGLKYIKKLIFGCVSRLQAAPGAVAICRKTMQSVLTSRAEAAQGVTMHGKPKVITGCKAAGASVQAVTVPVMNDTIASEHTAQASTAAVVGMNITNAFHIGYAAKLYSWFLAERNGNELNVNQVFSGVQSGEVLEIDLEVESAYWANARVADGTLDLVFAETTIPAGNTLEVV